MKKTRSIQLLCSLLIGVIFMLVIFAGLMIYDRVSAGSPRLVFSTNSAEAEYDATPLTNHQWTLLNGGLKTGHKIITTFTGSRTDAGISENTMTAIIVDENGKDVTDEYIVSYEYGTLKINHRILRLDASTDFKNITAVNGRYTLTSQELGLVANHFALVFVSTTTDELGLPVENIEDVKVYDENRNEVTHNYQIFIREKGENILIPGEGNGEGGGILPSLDGSADSSDDNIPMFSVRSSVSGMVYFRTLSCGDYLGDRWDTAPTFPALYEDQYAASYLTSFYLAQRGIPLNQLEIVPYRTDYPLPYYAGIGDGYAIQRNDTVNSGPTDDSYVVPFYFYPGDIPYATGNADPFEKAYRKFVYENYTAIDRETLSFMKDIIAEQGFSGRTPETINQVASYIQNSAKYNKNYNRGLDKATNNAIAFLSQYKEGVCRHFATAATLLYRALGFPARYTVGAAAEVTANTWVEVVSKQSHAWVEVYIDGVGWIPVEVTGGGDGSGSGGGGVCEDCGDGECDGNCGGGGGGGGGGGAGGNEAGQPATLELVPKTVTKKYDGTPLVSNGLISGMEELERMGYTYNAVISGSQTNIGVAQSIIESITIYDPRGQDVTASFMLETKPGRIHVYLFEITIYSRDIQQTYNGRAPASGIYYDKRELDGDTIRITYTADPNVGTKLVSYDVTIVNSDNIDVSNHYLIHKKYGTAVITPLEITLQAGSATKKYDGTALVCEDFYLLEGSLITRHSFAQVTTSGAQIDIGRCENIITSVIIVDAEGNDMTGNYTIRLESGTLRVKGS